MSASHPGTDTGALAVAAGVKRSVKVTTPGPGRISVVAKRGAPAGGGAAQRQTAVVRVKR